MTATTTPSSNFRFLRLRAIAFSTLILACLVWCTLVSVFLFLKWDTTDSNQRSLLAVMLAIHAATPVVLLCLLVLRFRSYLDMARIVLLISLHLGTAALFSYWLSSFKCPTRTPDEQAVCRLFGLYILLASWVVPAILLAYAAGLGYFMGLQRRAPPPAMLERESILPVMRPGYSRATSYSSQPDTRSKRGSAEEQRKHISGLSSQTSASRSFTTHSGLILSKPPPAFFAA
ncbi:hypothetical protein MKEN_01195000 [Mycena kentingensis (nom. inval.)]|nr:hypothetical protein MKEN_01195000 [Mycena kentingensis (nom. inval.)]